MFKKGYTPWNKGKPALNKGIKGIYHHTNNAKKKISKFRKGKTPWNKGKKSPQCGRSGKSNHSWQGGISYNPYPEEWTDVLKESIRMRDKYVCQLCEIHEDELQGRFKHLSVHHIDYNKENCNPDNLITLCKSCHIKTNFNRSYWIKYFNQLMNNKNE